jgi:hypothetical protein
MLEMFKSSPRGHGWADPERTIYDETKGKTKFMEGAIGWKRVEVSVERWMRHLRGEEMVGLGPVMDDGLVYWGCIDVDKYGDCTRYDFDIVEIRNAALRQFHYLIPVRSKSGGLHLYIRFRVGVKASQLMECLKRICSYLNLAGNEVFPKQARLTDPQDAPSWVFMPYDTDDHCAITETGGNLLVEEFVEIYGEVYADPSILEDKGSSNAQPNGNGNGRTKSTGRWLLDGATPQETFKHGPYCLSILAELGVSTYQHNFLFNCATFFKRKYSENWEDALRWVNYFILKPPGDQQKLEEMIKDMKHRTYEYTCDQPPINGRCNARICRLETYGVGNGKGDSSKIDFGITILKTVPAVFFVGEDRMQMEARDLNSLDKFNIKRMEHRMSMIPPMKKHEWTELVNRNLEDAVVVEPGEVYREGAEELRLLERFTLRHVPMMVRARGEEYLSGKCGDFIRLKHKQEKMFFKLDVLEIWCERNGVSHGDIDKLRAWLNRNAVFYKANELRDWFRSKWSIRYEQIDPGALDRCLNPDATEVFVDDCTEQHQNKD